MCGAGGEGAERRGRERRSASERANEQGISAQLLSVLKPARAATGRGHRETDRRTAPGSRAAAAARLAGRGDRAGCRYVPSLACWRTCVAGVGATIRVLAGTWVGVHVSRCELNVNARVSVDRCKWMFGVYVRVHLGKGLGGVLIRVRVCVSAFACPRMCLERVCPNV